MAPRFCSWLAAITIAVAFVTAPAVAQDPKRFKSGIAEMRPDGEWAIGYWQGNLVHLGSASSGALARKPRALVVERNGSNTVTCSWLGGKDTSTQRCQITKAGIDLVIATGTAIDFARSGPDALQGLVKWKDASVGYSTGSGTQAFMNRLTPTSDFGWAVGLFRGKIDGASFGKTSARTLRIIAKGGRPICYWGVGERENETTQGCLISATQISLVTSGESSVDLQRNGTGLRGSFRTDQYTYDVEFERLR